MTRASKYLEQFEDIFEIRLLEASTCGKQKFMFSTGKEIEPGAADKIRAKVESILTENKMELVGFHAGGDEIFIEVKSKDLSDLVSRLGKTIEGQLKSKIKEEDLEDSNVES